jgi:hypothetical protein
MHKKDIVVIMQGKKMINFRFIVLLCIAFLFQHLSFATEQKTDVFTSHPCGVTQNNYFEKGTAQNHSSQLHIVVEAESEDEDDVHNDQDVCNGLVSSNQNFKALYFANTFNALYLKLASNNQHKVDLPFFILYHCWKSHLA